MWGGTRTRGVTTSSSTKSARSTTNTSENEETVRVQQTDTGHTEDELCLRFMIV